MRCTTIVTCLKTSGEIRNKEPAMLPRVLTRTKFRFIPLLGCTRSACASVWQRPSPFLRPLTAISASFGTSPFPRKPPETRFIPLKNLPRAASLDNQETTAHAVPAGPVKSQDPDNIDFNIPIAVALAGAAFESYAGISADAIVQKCDNGCDVVYTDQKFLCTKLAGLLKISLEEIYLEGHNHHNEEESTNAPKTIPYTGIDINSPWGKETHHTVKLTIGDSCLNLKLSKTFPQNKDNEQHQHQGTANGTTNINADGTEDLRTGNDDHGSSDSSTDASSSDSPSEGYIFVRDLQRDRLSVRMGDDGGNNKESYGAFVPLSEVTVDEENRSEEKIVQLELRDLELKKVGMVMLKAKFIPFSGEFDYYLCVLWFPYVSIL